MSADRIISMLSDIRPRGEDRWIARCPAHDDHSPSLSIRQTSDRVLMRCWAGCTVDDICSAIGITLADLYRDRRRGKPDPDVLRRRRAAEGLDNWRQAELRRCREELRSIDTLRLAITAAVQAGTMTEDEAWAKLANVYAGYSWLEYRFEVLRTGTDRDALEIYRHG